MRFADLVAAADRAGATSSRTAKRDALAGALRELAPDEIAVAVGLLMGDPRQGRIGVGWSTVRAVSAPPAATPTLVVLDVDRVLDRVMTTTGSGSVAARHELLHGLFERATAPEADFLRRLLLGDLHQGALEGVLTDAVAVAAGVPATVVRRAMMLRGDLRETAAVALTEGRDGLERIGLSVGRPVQPMLAGTATDVGAALADTLAPGRDGTGATLASVEWKLDGARIQVHRDGDDVRIFTRNLNEVTSRLPEVRAVTLALPARQLVLDGEVLSVRDDHRPVAFQDTMSRFGRELAADDAAPERGPVPGDDGELPSAAAGRTLRPFFFDVLHADGQDLIDVPLGDRLTTLAEVTGPHRVPGLVTADPDEAQRFLDATIDAGHEGVMVKSLDSPYQAGRRGKGWRKVKPVRLLDLVVLAVEWGSGRRQGWLSNLHLGARDPEHGGFVMVGKTFKGMTDALLAWQTEQLLARELAREGHVVHVRPELVVEIALDGVQASTRYPGGVALRFARVKRYRDDKTPAEADTITTVQSWLPDR